MSLPHPWLSYTPSSLFLPLHPPTRSDSPCKGIQLVPKGQKASLWSGVAFEAVPCCPVAQVAPDSQAGQAGGVSSCPFLWDVSRAWG